MEWKRKGGKWSGTTGKNCTISVFEIERASSSAVVLCGLGECHFWGKVGLEGDESESFFELDLLSSGDVRTGDELFMRTTGLATDGSGGFGGLP